MLDTSSTDLGEVGIDALGRLGLLAHQIRHRNEPAVIERKLIEHCTCEIAETIRGLHEVMQKVQVQA